MQTRERSTATQRPMKALTVKWVTYSQGQNGSMVVGPTQSHKPDNSSLFVDRLVICNAAVVTKVAMLTVSVMKC